MALEHDPEKVVRDLAGKLASRARHACVFLGAGASVAAGLPTVTDLQALVSDALSEPYKSLYADQLAGRTLEQALSRVRRIRGLLTTGESLGGMDADQAAELDRLMCAAIARAVDSAGKDDTAFVNLASWAGRMETERPVEIFTVNYDLLVESGLETLGLPYFDGFVGNIRARFATELVEPNEGRSATRLPAGFIRLWKLHGSTNWVSVSLGARTEIVRTANPSGAAAAIYPSDEKYDDSRRLPFVVLIDRFRRALLEPETVTLVAGYSWGDDHLNEILFDAAQRHPRSEIVAFCFADIPDEVERRAATTPNLLALCPDRAILGGQSAPWLKPPADIPGVFEGGKFLLGDFARLASFLASQVKPNDRD